MSRGPGRPHRLDDREFAQSVAEAFAAGLSRRDIADLFDVTNQTVTRWRRDARVKVIAMKIIEDRVLEITRKVDATISTRLQHAERLTTRELLMIRREFLGGSLRAKTESVDDETIGEAMEAMEDNPELVTELQEIFAGKNAE